MESESEIEIDAIENEIEKLQMLKVKTLERKRQAAEQAAKRVLAERAAKMTFRVESVPMFKTGQSWWRIGHHFYCSERRRKANNTTVITHYLRCGDNSCPVKLKWCEGTSVSMTQFRCAHNHAPQSWIIDRNRMFQALKEAVLRTGTEDPSLHEIYSLVAARYPTGSGYLPFDKVKSSMRRWLKLVMPKRGSANNMTSLDERLRTHPYYRARYAGSVSVGGECAIVLAMEGFGSCLGACDTMLMDVVKDLPKPISVLLTIHALIQKMFYSPVVILMSAESEKLYEVVLGFVFSAMGVPRPQRVVAPYSHELLRALRATGITAPIQGCYFQYSQDLLRQANDMGLDVYTRSEQWELIRLYVALALLPSQAIPQAFQGLPEVTQKNQLPFSQEFHEYFEKHWLKRNISVSKNPHRTTNVCEQYQTSVRRQLSYKPTIWYFIDFLRRVLNTTSDRYVQKITLNRDFRRNMAKQMVVYRNLQHAKDLESGKISFADYLVLISKTITPLLVISNHPEVVLMEELADVKDEDNEFAGADFEDHEPQFDEDSVDEREEAEDGAEDIKYANMNVETANENDEEESAVHYQGQQDYRPVKEEQESLKKDNKNNVMEDRLNWQDSDDEFTEPNTENKEVEVDIEEVHAEENENEQESRDSKAEQHESQQIEYLDDWADADMLEGITEARDSASSSPPPLKQPRVSRHARTTRTLSSPKNSHPETLHQLSANHGPTSSRVRVTKLQQTSSQSSRDRDFVTGHHSRSSIPSTSLRNSECFKKSFVNPSIPSKRQVSLSHETFRDTLNPEHSVSPRRSVSPSHSVISTGSVATKRYVISRRPVSPKISRHITAPKQSVNSRISVSSSHSVTSRQSGSLNNSVRPAVSGKTVISKRLGTPSQSTSKRSVSPSHSVTSSRSVTSNRSVTLNRSISSIRPAASYRPVASRQLVTPNRSVTPDREFPEEEQARDTASSSKDPPAKPWTEVRCGLCRQYPPSEALLRCGHTLCGVCRETSAVGDPCPYCDVPIEGFLRIIV